MFLRKNVNRKTGRTYLSIVQGYRDKKEGSSRTATIESLGYLDELEKEYEDPVAHFSIVVDDMNKKKYADNLPATFTFNMDERIDQESVNRKIFGYATLSKIYHELEIDKFYQNRQRHLHIEYSLNAVMKLLTFSRILDPCSKMKTFEAKDRYFEKFDFSLDDVYRSLFYINKHKDALQLWIHNHIKKQYNRNTELVYYDVTNYYFEIDEQDRLRKKGVSKEHRPNPIVQMGLLMDAVGMPVAYKLFSGNATDCTTLIPILSQVKNDYNLGRIIVVADKGLNTSDNICYNILSGDGYVYSQSIRGTNKELKQYVLDERGYTFIGTDYKKKSRLYPREIYITNAKGKKVKTMVDEKQVIFYSQNYDKRAKAEREPTLKKAMELINDPGKFNRATSYGAAKYVKDLVFDKNTGEIITTCHRPELNLDKLNEDEKYDGYYAIVTSEYKETAEHIIEIYRGLWKIEESFRITKGDLSARPVYLSREEHIEAHFLICFLSLVIIRILEYKTRNKYSPCKMIDSLNQVSCTYLKENYYLFDYFDDIVQEIGSAVNIDFSKRIVQLSEIKKILGDTKKHDLHNNLLTK